MPEQGPYYSANEANAASWPEVYREYVQGLVRGNLGGRSMARGISGAWWRTFIARC
jgi:fructose-1,6-bisphosphatase I